MRELQGERLEEPVRLTRIDTMAESTQCHRIHTRSIFSNNEQCGTKGKCDDTGDEEIRAIQGKSRDVKGKFVKGPEVFYHIW